MFMRGFDVDKGNLRKNNRSYKKFKIKTSKVPA